MDIPGYYFDAEKKRYFKVESGKTAPTNAAWFSGNVKRRKLRDEDAATVLRHSDLAKSRIRRARVLHEPLTGGFFAREYGAMKADIQAFCFVEGLRHKGRVLMDQPSGRGSQVKRMCIAGSDHGAGVCAAYAILNDWDVLLSTYFPRDKNKHLDQRLLANYGLPYSRRTHWEEHLGPRLTNLKYSAYNDLILVTSGSSSHLTTLWYFLPTDDHHDEDPLHRSGVTVRIHGISKGDEAHCIAPAPESSPLRCLVGTSRGVAKWDRASGNSAGWLMPPAPFSPNPKRQSQADLFRDVFAIDFHPSQPEVLRFGGRPGALFTADTRIPQASWSHLKLPSTITHLRCLGGGNQVLVAGLQNQLGVYDLRFVRSYRGAEDDGERVETNTTAGKSRNTDNNLSYKSQRGRFNRRYRNKPDGRGENPRGKWGNDHDPNNAVAQPVIKFEHYRNTAHADIGFAYDADTGVVAAAHDDIPGTVALYSVRTGSRLRVLDMATEQKSNGRPRRPRPILDVDRERERERERERINLPIIQSVEFYTFPGDHTPTLFVGGDRRGRITAFTFGVEDLEDEA